MNRKIKTILSVVLSTLTITSLFAGCGKGGSSTTSASASKNEIVLWTPLTGPDGDTMTSMIADYNKTNPKYKVKHVPIEANDMYTKIPSVVSSGKNVPDLTIVHAERIPLFVKNDMLVSYDDAISKDGNNIKEENYLKEGWRVGAVDNKRYGVPLDVHSYITYYNPDLLAKYGPHVLDDGVITMDEVKEVGEAAKKDKIAAIGVDWMRVMTLAWIKQLGGEITSDGTKPTVNTPQAEKALTTMKSFVTDKIATQDGDDPQQLFMNGKLVFWPEGIWMRNGLKDAKSPWKMTNFITFDKDKLVNWSSSHNFVMFKNPARDEAKTQGIVDFLKWMQGNSLKWATEAGQNPASMAVQTSAEFAKEPQAFLAKEPEALHVFNYQYYGYVAESLDKIVLDTVFGKMDVKKGLEQAQKETEDRIASGK